MADLRELVLSKVDIADLVGQYVALKPAGREFKACCPFHEEKTPSFTVSPEKGFFHCFGCKAGGTVIDFVMRIENLEFRDALEWLANRYNIEIPAYKGGAGGGQQRGEKERLYNLNEAALKFFRQSLKSPDAEAVQKYLEDRGITSQQAAEFDLGYAPRSWQALTDLLLSRGAKSADLTKLGLIKERKESATSTGGEGQRHYDTFRHRLIFPIRSVTGRVIGFAGRTLSDEDQPKYLNVTNTPLYDKSKALYNLDKAKGLIRTDGAVIVEGYMDVIGLAKAGVGNAVATCGTALTDEHIKLLLRYGDRIYLAFDGDRAGRDAAWKAGRMFLLQGIDAKVVSFPEGVDPDDYAGEHGIEGWNGLLASAKGVARFWLEHQLAANPNPDLATQRQLVGQLAPLYQQLRDELLRQQVKQEMASALQLGAAEVTGLLSGGRPHQKYKGNPKAQLRDEARKTALTQGTEPIEREILRRILIDEEFRLTFGVVGDPAWFSSGVLKAAYETLITDGNPDSLAHDPKFSQLYAEICAFAPMRDDNEQLINLHQDIYLNRSLTEVEKQCDAASQAGDIERERELQHQYYELKKQIKNTRGIIK